MSFCLFLKNYFYFTRLINDVYFHYTVMFPFHSRTIESSSEMSEFDRACVYIDSDFKTEDNFTVRAAWTYSSVRVKTTRWSTAPTVKGCVCVCVWLNCMLLFCSLIHNQASKYMLRNRSTPLFVCIHYLCVVLQLGFRERQVFLLRSAGSLY